MAVYVDSGRRRLGRMLMAHMTADSLDELHAMAERIGLWGYWFQDHGEHPHYDVCQAARKRAIEAGAVIVRPRDIARIARKLKA